ncbi:SDR family oxidoreductase [Jongsikchunia kroppenstedtii]|jgi:NAD(P)-dependent dehydrogenase (short-subunit alcohol dehydrogenase family)|uniref:SDR family oxidoreductase n=1 Tax=Jongsikchunia kroppenstedtii TaxID=1121721 RepID=UPI00035CF326|nr:SDR family oxidoreductase [Jongsikchunia kroppenstedtii]
MNVNSDNIARVDKNAPVYLGLGVGPGLGLAAARRFARAGHVAVLGARNADRVAQLAAALTDEGNNAEGIAVDLSSAVDTERAVTEVADRYGRIDVLHFNPSAWREKDPLELTADELLADLALGVAALLPAVQAARPALPPGARVLVTGSAAADKPWFKAASLGVQKAGLRNLTRSLDTALKPVGVRAVCLQIDGILADEGEFSPPPIAEAMWQAATRPDEGWTSDVAYPPTGSAS